MSKTWNTLKLSSYWQTKKKTMLFLWKKHHGLVPRWSSTKFVMKLLSSFCFFRHIFKNVISLNLNRQSSKLGSVPTNGKSLLLMLLGSMVIWVTIIVLVIWNLYPIWVGRVSRKSYWQILSIKTKMKNYTNRFMNKFTPLLKKKYLKLTSLIHSWISLMKGV